jgi:hypothetical protein
MKNIEIKGSSFNLILSGTSQGVESQIATEPQPVITVAEPIRMNKTIYLDINNIKLYDRIIR